MSGRMQRYLHTIDENRLFPFDGLIIIIAQAQLQQGFALCMTEIMLHAPPGMIAMCVGDDSIVYRSPGIDVEVALPAKQTFIGEFNERHSGCLIHRFHYAVYLLNEVQFFVLKIVEGHSGFVQHRLNIEVCKKTVFLITETGAEVGAVRKQQVREMI